MLKPPEPHTGHAPESIPVLGVLLSLRVEYQGQTCELPLIVSSQGQRSHTTREKLA